MKHNLLISKDSSNLTFKNAYSSWITWLLMLGMSQYRTQYCTRNYFCFWQVRDMMVSLKSAINSNVKFFKKVLKTKTMHHGTQGRETF